MKALCLIVWMFITLLLTASVIGLTLFIPQVFQYRENIPSTWMQIGKKLLYALLDDTKN